MGKYLKATDGIFRNETRSDWELEAVAGLLFTNNAAERPFGIAKAYCMIYPSMNLRTLASYSLSMANGSHRAPGTNGKQKRAAHAGVFGGGCSLYLTCGNSKCDNKPLWRASGENRQGDCILGCSS